MSTVLSFVATLDANLTSVITCQTNDNVVNELNPKIDNLLPIVPKLEGLIQEVEKFITSETHLLHEKCSTSFKSPAILDHVRESMRKAENVIAATSGIGESQSANNQGTQEQATSSSSSGVQGKDILEEWIRQLSDVGIPNESGPDVGGAPEVAPSDSVSNIGNRPCSILQPQSQPSYASRISQAGNGRLNTRTDPWQHARAEAILDAHQCSRQPNARCHFYHAGQQHQRSKSKASLPKSMGFRDGEATSHSLLELNRLVCMIPTKRDESEVIAALLHLFSRGADINATDEAGDSVLHIASFRGHTSVVDLLCEGGANVTAKNHSGLAPLHIAAMQPRENVPIVKLLLEYGAQINQRTSGDDYTPLSIAVNEGRSSIVKCLLTAGANINIPDWKGHLPLHRAAFRGKNEEAALLLDAGAGTESRCRQGNTALHYACARGKIAIAELLLQAGANIDAVGPYDMTPLHAAQISRNKKTTLLLLDLGAPIDARDRLGQTALMLAVQAGDPDSVNHLLASGPDLEAQNEDGETALYHALHYRDTMSAKMVPLEEQVAVFALLCERGADLNAMGGGEGVSIVNLIINYLDLGRRRDAFLRVLKRCGVRITAALEDVEMVD